MGSLIGKRAKIQCNLNGLAVNVLLDTGTQVSMISHAWKEINLPNLDIKAISKIVEGIEELYVINEELIFFYGWVPITLNLPGNKDPSLSICVSAVWLWKSQ